MSRILTVAREDARQAIRSRLVWSATVLLAVMFLPSTGTSARPDIYPIEEYLLLIPVDLMTFSLVVVAAVCYSAIVGERVTGTVRFVLGLPATRRDLVLGKLLSRSVVVAVALGVILTIANLLVVQGYGSPHLAAFWVMGSWMFGYVMVWSAVAVGYSAAFESPYRTIGALVVTYVGFSFNFGVWGVLVRPAFALVFTGSADAPTYESLVDAPLWFRVTERLNPLVDFWQAARWSVDAVGPGTPTGGALPHLAGTVVFLAFGAAPLVVGIRRFEGADLGTGAAGFEFGARLRRSLWPVRAALTRSHARLAARTKGGCIRLLAAADARHALQNWVVAGALVVTLLLVGPRLWTGIDTSGIATVSRVIRDLPSTFALPVLVLGMAVGHNAVVGERTSGTGRFVLGLPATRRALLLGKLCSRVGLAVVTLLPLVLFAEALVVVRLGGLYPGAFAAWAGWVLLFAAVWTTVAVGSSAAVASRYRSLAVVFGTYLLFGRDVGLWDPVVRPVFMFVFTGRLSGEGYATDADPPMWFRYTDHLNPFVALETIREGVFTVTGYSTRYADVSLPLIVYSCCVVGLFATVAVAVGARQFSRADL